MTVIIGRLVYSAKLELVLDRIVLDRIVLRAKYDSYILILIRKLIGSIDI